MIMKKKICYIWKLLFHWMTSAYQWLENIKTDSTFVMNRNDSNKLVLNYITNPFSTLKRALSHYGKGFFMENDELAKLYTDSYLMSDFNLEAVSPYEAKQIKRSLYNFSGVSDEKVGQIMSKWAYIGVGLGLIGTYAYLGLLKSNKQTLLVGSLFTLGGLSIGSYIGTREVEKLKK